MARTPLRNDWTVTVFLVSNLPGPDRSRWVVAHITRGGYDGGLGGRGGGVGGERPNEAASAAEDPISEHRNHVSDAIADSWRNTPECDRRQAGDGSVSALP